MKFDYAYHITADGKLIFLGAKLQIKLKETKGLKEVTLQKIGPKGIYVEVDGLMNSQFYNFDKIESIEEV